MKKFAYRKGKVPLEIAIAAKSDLPIGCDTIMKLLRDGEWKTVRDAAVKGNVSAGAVMRAVSKLEKHPEDVGCKALVTYWYERFIAQQ